MGLTLFFFLHQKGPKVIHQVPEGSIVSAGDDAIDSQQSPFFSFPAVSSFVIPRQSLCGNLISLVPPASTPQSPSYLVLGYPICITSPSYPRNEFIFNFALVLSTSESPDVSAYKSVVTKLAHLMHSLEEQSHFLSADASPPGTGKLYSLCEMLMEDLNNYCECMIPIDELNTLNIKLFPTYSPPPPVRAWHVPIFTVRPETLMDENWDLTMQRVVPHINGISSVKQIALLADADFSLTRRCMKHLLYYGCLLLLDIFSFSAVYAPTAHFSGSIASDTDMQRECARYVNTAFAPVIQEYAVKSIDSTGEVLSRQEVMADDEDDVWPLTNNGKRVDGVGIMQLFATLRQGQSVREWYTNNSNALANIDMRRFITFGVIKGFLYRVHKYAFAPGEGFSGNGHSHSKSLSLRKGAIGYGHRNVKSINGDHTTAPAIPRSMASELHFAEENERGSTRTLTLGAESDSGTDDEDWIGEERLGRYFDGSHCFDQICTELEISEKELLDRIKAFPGEVLVIHR